MGYGGSQYMSPGGTGQLRVGGSQEAGPSIVCRAVLIKAAEANADKIYIAFSNTSVKVLQAADDTDVGFELGAGDNTGWIPSGGNMNLLNFIAGAADQDLTYMYLT